MHRTLTSLFAALALVACSKDDDAFPAVVDSVVYGLWRSVGEGVNCESTLRTNTDHTFVFASYEDRTTGVFRLGYGGERGDEYLLVLDVLADTELQDCDGRIALNLDDIVTLVEFSDPDSMTWYEEGMESIRFVRVSSDE